VGHEIGKTPLKKIAVRKRIEIIEIILILFQILLRTMDAPYLLLGDPSELWLDLDAVIAEVWSVIKESRIFDKADFW
tara:strand:+ start:20816 stop:21046 length:231 start_codon:yes stop_codon:yes gene_type:complete